MTIINGTPHAINVVGSENQIIQTLEPSGICPRCNVYRETIGEINGIPVDKNVYGEIVGLPEYKEGVVYIVSRIVAEAAPNRADLLIVGDTVRDDSGRIIGCRSFARI